jgi:curved DNA-binding protein CbpA
MEPGITWYEVLGVLPSVQPEKIRQKYDERMGLLRGEMIAGAPSNVLTAVDRARHFLDTAWEILGDPASRNRYDGTAGFHRKGLAPSGSFATSSWHDSADSAIVGDMGGDALAGLLELGGFLGGGPRRPSKVPVPDVRGLFYDVCMEVVGRLGLRVRSVQLTPHPMPVDGLVVGQAPAATGKLRRGETVLAHVWHPPIRTGRLGPVLDPDVVGNRARPVAAEADPGS